MIDQEPSLPPSPWSWTTPDLKILLIFGVLAVVARSVIMGPMLDHPDDHDGYLAIARSLAGGDGFAVHGRLTAYRPPLYPILLAPLARVLDPTLLPWGIAGFHLVLGALTVVLAADTGRRWGYPRRSVWVAAMVAAFDPVLVVQSRFIMTETLAAFLVAATLWSAGAFSRWRSAVACGFALGLASLCRPSLLPASVLAGLAGGIVAPGRRADRIARLILIPATTLLVLAPWAIRNARVVGEPVFTTTHGGYTLALANNEVYYAEVVEGPSGAVWSGPRQADWFVAVDQATKTMTEPEADRWLRDLAIGTAKAHPSTFLRATLDRLGRFWGAAPSAAVYPGRLRAATAAWTLPLWAGLIVGLTHRAAWRWPSIVAPVFLVTLSAIHAVYWTDLRMRAPLVPAIALIAARSAHSKSGSGPQKPGP